MTNKDFLKSIAKKYSLKKEDFWQHKQSGQWILSHDGVIKAAAQEGISFSIEPFSVTSERVVVKVTASRAGGEPVEMIGECRIGGKGIPAEYPFAMAQKRGEDRAALRIIGAGEGLYSEIEAEVFARPNQGSALDAIKKQADAQAAQV